MSNVTIGRYDNPSDVGYQGWIEPDDRTWIAFVATSGAPIFFLDRDPDGGVL